MRLPQVHPDPGPTQEARLRHGSRPAHGPQGLPGAAFPKRGSFPIRAGKGSPPGEHPANTRRDLPARDESGEDGLKRAPLRPGLLV